MHVACPLVRARGVRRIQKRLRDRASHERRVSSIRACKFRMCASGTTCLQLEDGMLLGARAFKQEPRLEQQADEMHRPVVDGTQCPLSHASQTRPRSILCSPCGAGKRGAAHLHESFNVFRCEIVVRSTGTQMRPAGRQAPHSVGGRAARQRRPHRVQHWHAFRTPRRAAGIAPAH